MSKQKMVCLMACGITSRITPSRRTHKNLERKTLKVVCEDLHKEILILLLVYIRWEYGVLEKMGVPVVKHHPLLGSTRETYETVCGLNDKKWMDDYGPIFGVYDGRQPQLFVCVPELVRLMCVKDADYFNGKPVFEFGNPVMNEISEVLRPAEKWRFVRALATPAFTVAKIKQMNLPMVEATQDFVNYIKEKIKADNGVYEKFPVDIAVHTMLTDLIGRCVFSIRIGANRDNDNEFARIVRDMLTSPVDNHSPELVMWSHSLPIIKKFIPSIFNAEPVDKFVKIFRQMVDERKRSGKKFNDVVDMCVEWYDKLDTPEFKQNNVNEYTIMAHALVFYIASQDQVSTMVSTVIYHLTQDPEMEQRFYAEVDAVFDKHKDKIEHEQLTEFTYLNACINESLRLYPVFHRTERLCTKDWSNKQYNLHIKKGMTIIFPIWAINRNSEYNENPEKYDPERFMPENKHKLNPYASTSFGHGPRNCTGMRFAYEVMPLILAYLLRHFKFVGRKDTQLKFIPGGPFLQPHDIIYVDVMERSK